MKQVTDWLKDWQHVILACVCLICATVAGILVPTDRWEKLAHYLADPATLVTFTALGGVGVAMYRRARGLPPALLVLALLAVPVSGCGGALTDSQRVALTVETQRCLVNEREIVDRSGTTEAQDRADLAAERARCDGARAAIVGGGQ